MHEQDDSFLRKGRTVSIPAEHRITLVGIPEQRIGTIPVREGPDVVFGRFRENQRSVDEIRWSVAGQIREEPAVLSRAHRNLHNLFRAVAKDRESQLVIASEPLHQVVESEVVIVNLHHPCVVDRVIADPGHDVAGPQRIRSVVYVTAS